jgi:DNA-binding XRE family transcriptional regulator
MALNALGVYARQRGHEIGLSMAELARRAGISRQTLHSIGNGGERLPEMQTLIKLAAALRVHPLHLVHLAFENYRLSYELAYGLNTQRDAGRFMADVGIRDGMTMHTDRRLTRGVMSMAEE